MFSLRACIILTSDALFFFFNFLSNHGTDFLLFETLLGTFLSIDSFMPVLSVVQSSSMAMFTALVIISESWFISLKILSQLALEKMKYFLGFCLMNYGRISRRVTWTCSIPGADS